MPESLEPTWENQLRLARGQRSKDLEPHAEVSVRNKCTCNDCYCCAALAVLMERKREPSKRAVIRDSNVAMGLPAPLHINCLCGQACRVDSNPMFSNTCSCGRVYDARGNMFQ